MLLPKMKTKRFDVWGLPILALTLLALGLVEYPFALHKEASLRVIDAGSYMREILLMLLPALAAFWLGWKAEWPELRDIPPHYWLILAFALALLPPALHLSYGNRPAWRMDIDGLIVHIDAGLASSVAFLGWIASLRINARKISSSFEPWMSTHYSAPILMLVWFWLVSSVNDYFLMAGLVVLPVAVLSLRGTTWFTSTLWAAGFLVGSTIVVVLASAYRRMRFARNFIPYDDPFGYHFAVLKIQQVYQASSFLGGDSGIYYPRASNQYMLVTLMEHLGWLGMGLVILAVVLFFVASFTRLNNQPASWLKEFSLCLWGFLVVGFMFNLLAASTLTARPGIGTPFIAHEFFIAAIAAFITGVSMRGVAKTFRSHWPHLSIVEHNINTDKIWHSIAHKDLVEVRGSHEYQRFLRRPRTRCLQQRVSPAKLEQARFLGLVRFWHEGHTRADQVKHCTNVMRLLEQALDMEPVSPTTRQAMLLAALGHDLYEDSGIEPGQVAAEYGSDVDRLIEAMTERCGVDEYIERMASGPEEARLIKLCDGIDNYSNLVDGGLLQSDPDYWIGIVRRQMEPMFDRITPLPFQQFPIAGGLLRERLEKERARFWIEAGHE